MCVFADTPSQSDSASEYCTPCGLVASKRATFALNSPEGVVHWQTHPDAKQPKLIAVAACLQVGGLEESLIVD